MNILQILEKAVSQDQNEIRQAHDLLEQFCRSNISEYLRSLSEILANKELNSHVRMLAGLQLKNQLTSKDDNERKRLQQQWLAIPIMERDPIKMNVINSLGTEASRPSASSQCVAYIAAIELPNNLWPDLINWLLMILDRNEATKIAVLETIGYIRQEVSPELLVSKSDAMLTAIVNNMRKDEPSNIVKLTATKALLNSLEYIQVNFGTENERHFIMQVVCEATQCSDINVQKTALECLVEIVSLFYQHMEQYMSFALFPIILHAIRSPDPDICLGGIEFWSNVCEKESELQFEASEAAEQGRPPLRTSKFYAKGALQFLVPFLLNIMTKQDEDADEDEWNPCRAASVCLALFANCTGDDIIAHVLPFIVENINSTDWHFREAAMMALGSILEGPSQSQLLPIVQQAFSAVISLTKDPHVCVRDTTMWVLSVICQQMSDIIFKSDILKIVLEVLIEGLKAEPRVAVHSCLAFNSLSESANDIACNQEGVSEYPKSTALSEYFETIITHLLSCTERQDSSINNLRSAAYEAIMEMIKYSPQNCYEIVKNTSVVILDRLNGTLYMKIGNLDKPLMDIQSLLCTVLQAIIKRMIEEDIPKISDSIMTVTVRMLEATEKSGNLSEDGLLVGSSLADVLEVGFFPYLHSFVYYLLIGLRSHQNSQLCSASIGVVSDLCQSTGKLVAPYCDEWIVALMEVLKSSIAPSIKSQVLSVFGDIAMAIGADFEKYLNTVLETMIDAVTTSVHMQNNSQMAHSNHTNYDLIEYLNDLWENILEGYVGIVQAFKGDDKDKPNQNVIRLLQPHVNYINQFLLQVASRCDDLPDSVICRAAGLIGDLISAFGADMLPLCEHMHIQQLFNRGKKSRLNKTKTLVNFALKEMKRVKSSALQSQQGQEAQQQMFASQVHNTATAS